MSLWATGFEVRCRPLWKSPCPDLLVPNELDDEILGGALTECRDPRLAKLNLQSENALTREASPLEGARRKSPSSSIDVALRKAVPLLHRR